MFPGFYSGLIDPRLHPGAAAAAAAAAGRPPAQSAAAAAAAHHHMAAAAASHWPRHPGKKRNTLGVLQQLVPTSRHACFSFSLQFSALYEYLVP